MRKAHFFKIGLDSLIVLLSFGVVSCAEVPERPVPLSEQLPQVLYVVPGPSEKISTRPKWAIAFSKPIDESTLKTDSVLLARGTVEATRYKGLTDPKAGEKGEPSTLALKFSVREKGVLVIALPDTTNNELLPNETYTLLVTPRLFSTDHLPMNTPFAAVYQTADAGVRQELDEIFQETPPSKPADAPKKPAPVMPPPAKLPTPELPAPKKRPVEPVSDKGKVVLNEIYLEAAAKDEDGVLFIELYGTPGLTVGGYKINFVKGGDGKVYDTITLPKEARLRPDGYFVIADGKKGAPGSSKVPGADLVDNFHPKNGSGALQLLDAARKLVDVVGYGKELKPTAENKLATSEGKPVAAVTKGHSLERKEPGLDSNNNDQDWVDRKVPTPGR